LNYRSLCEELLGFCEHVSAPEPGKA